MRVKRRMGGCAVLGSGAVFLSAAARLVVMCGGRLCGLEHVLLLPSWWGWTTRLATPLGGVQLLRFPCWTAVSEADGRVSFSVEDDGAGFDPGDVEPGAGLTNLTDRVAAVGGTLQIDGGPGRGARITGEIPIQR
jgi:hypothetical protein